MLLHLPAMSPRTHANVLSAIPVRQIMPALCTLQVNATEKYYDNIAGTIFNYKYHIFIVNG